MMRVDDRDLSLLHDMASSARLVREFTAETNQAAFAADRMMVAAVEWQMIVMGLAAGDSSAGTRDRFPEIRWKEMADFSDRLVRDYRDVKPDEVWAAARESTLKVLRVLGPALPPE